MLAFETVRQAGKFVQQLMRHRGRARAEPNAVGALQTENARLAALLDAHGIEWRLPPSLASQPVPALPACKQDPESPRSSLSTVEKVALFRRLFRGRTDVYPVRWEGKTSGASKGLVLAVVSQRTNLAARPRFDGWAR